ncbi:MAG TPA: CHAT domain-containing protein, partial [Longimicrobium sp.]|nr:CHAT domain-containing protein [Longimicrobium sp.]
MSDCLRACEDEARREGLRGVRIRLRLSDTPAVAPLVDLPWEYLYDPEQDRFLSHYMETPLVRYLESSAGLLPPLRVPPPLRVLVMTSSPPGHARLDVETEWRQLQGAVADLVRDGVLEVERVPSPTLPALVDTLQRGTYHVFQFMGHGRFDEATNESVLVLEDAFGRPAAVKAPKLAVALHDHRSLRLVVLNACEGARTSSRDVYAGIAQSLARRNLPAVIAMQAELTDQAALTFSHAFYQSLAAGQPVDAALAQARKLLYLGGNDVEWGAPVLYMRSRDGEIIDPTAPRVAKPASRAKAP